MNFILKGKPAEIMQELKIMENDNTTFPMHNFFDNACSKKDRKKVLAFLHFIFNNKHIYSAFFTAMYAKITNNQPTSTAFIYTYMRLRHEIQTDEETFKLSNDYMPFLSRLYLEENPHHDKFIVTKKSVADLVFYDKLLKTLISS